MDRPATFQRFLLGDLPIETEAEKRKLLLGAYLILMYMGIDLFYFVVNLFNPYGEVWSLLGGSLVSVLCLWLIRHKWINTAIFIHLLRANALAFYFASYDTDVYLTGSYVYFIPSCLGALAVFGYEERWKGIGFTTLSIILFSLSMFNWESFAPDDPHFYFVFNFLIVLVIGSLILLFFDRMVIGSERKLLEKNKELIKANAELDRFVYSVSHDLRAPLSSILGLVNIYGYATGQNEQQAIIDHIHARALKLDEFIAEILDYARNVRTDVRHVEVDVNGIVSEVLENLRFVKDFQKVKIALPPSNVAFETDPERLKIIFNNVLSNAVKYQDNNKEQSVIQIDIERLDQSLIITVFDNGIGIQSEHIAGVFGMFYRGNDKVEGSGLGLYIVKEAVESLGGRIEVSSEYGLWTSFRIILP